ncbi:MAG: transposase [Bacteroidia bacterium]|nr:transposase [Bacteroidia bacterium]MCB9232811.1 transposase [Bacteroidia bacterium]
MHIITSIVVSGLQLSKPQRDFLLTFFSTLFIIRGKATIANLARHSGLSERTFRRNYRKVWGFNRLNALLLDLLSPGECIAAIDATTIPKAGRKTFGVGWFWSGSRNSMIKGLEVSCIAIVSMHLRTAFALSARQTPAATRKLSRIDHYLKQVQACKRQLRKRVKYLVGDGFYSKKEFIDGVVGIGIDFIGRLRQDSNMRYIYKGPHEKRPGARRKYSGKFMGIHKRRFRKVSEIDEQTHLYSCLMYHVGFKRSLLVVALLNTRTQKYLLLFSTDTQACPEKVLEYYSTRFQIEFLFRDAKQHTGLEDCQSRDKQALDFHFNASLTAVNIAKLEILSKHADQKQGPISISDFKTALFNRFWLNRIISKLDLQPDIVINHPNYQSLLEFGVIAS